MKRGCSKMSLVPAFEIGLWNAWIITVFLLLIGMVPGLFISKERRDKMGKWPPLNKTEKILALSTHVVVMPAAAIYSIFLPLKLGTAWFYVGIPVCFVAGCVVLCGYSRLFRGGSHGRYCLCQYYQHTAKRTCYHRCLPHFQTPLVF